MLKWGPLGVHPPVQIVIIVAFSPNLTSTSVSLTHFTLQEDDGIVVRRCSCPFFFFFWMLCVEAEGQQRHFLTSALQSALKHLNALNLWKRRPCAFAFWEKCTRSLHLLRENQMIDSKNAFVCFRSMSEPPLKPLNKRKTFVCRNV